VPSNDDSKRFLAELIQTFEALADPIKARSMRSYMKDRFDFFGISAPDRRETQRILFAQFEPFDKPFFVAERLFARPRRELHYVACDLLRRHVQRKRPAPYDPHHALSVTERLILRRASSKEFFIRKGAGWALRELSKRDPQNVRAFLDENSVRLSPLTIREGGKYC
jgi:3-methyladenine DNA glycosylase AlkD